MAILISPVCICIFKKKVEKISLPTIRRTFGVTSSNLSIFCCNTFNHRKPVYLIDSLQWQETYLPPRPPTLGTTSIPFSQLQDSKTPAYDVIARFKSIYHGRNKKFIEAEKPFVLFCHQNNTPLVKKKCLLKQRLFNSESQSEPLAFSLRIVWAFFLSKKCSGPEKISNH